jgi:hypothetical protein
MDDGIIKIFFETLKEKLDHSDQEIKECKEKLIELDKFLNRVSDKNENHYKGCPLNPDKIEKMVLEMIETERIKQKVDQPQKIRVYMAWLAGIVVVAIQIYDTFFKK